MRIEVSWRQAQRPSSTGLIAGGPAGGGGTGALAATSGWTSVSDRLSVGIRRPG